MTPDRRELAEYGDPRLPERFWSKVNGSESGCWEWNGGVKGGRGYGQFRWNGKMIRAHRLTYEVLVHEIPDGLEIDHLCRNTACCNPQHLEPVTHAENVRRGRAGANMSDRTHCNHGHALTPDNVFMHPNRRRGCYYRSCRECRRIRNAKRDLRAYRARKKSALRAAKGGE